MDDQKERMKNKKYRSLKMFPTDIILKFINIVKGIESLPQTRIFKSQFLSNQMS